MAFLAPLVEGGRSVLLSYSPTAYLSAGLWVGAASHFLVLVASYQVPDELDWDTDLESLKPLNRKLMWTYGGYIVLSIVSFGVMTAVFHRQFLSGTAVALGLCAMIVVFWTIRVLVDYFYFSHDDWPEGIEYVVGHTMLTSLFLLLILIYSGPLVMAFA
jgi:alginate O-acetyltransferase complex protein AlgI